MCMVCLAKSSSISCYHQLWMKLPVWQHPTEHFLLCHVSKTCMSLPILLITRKMEFIVYFYALFVFKHLLIHPSIHLANVYWAPTTCRTSCSNLTRDLEPYIVWSHFLWNSPWIPCFWDSSSLLCSHGHQLLSWHSRALARAGGSKVISYYVSSLWALRCDILSSLYSEISLISPPSPQIL